MIRVGFTAADKLKVRNEVKALQVLQALQGREVPQLLDHGWLPEGGCYLARSFMQAICLPNVYSFER